MWTEGGSKACDAERHNECDGIQYVIDEDGHSRYRCDCFCHVRTSNPNAAPVEISVLRDSDTPPTENDRA